MVGVYDSGSGGLSSLVRLKECYPLCDVIYRGDLPNAPYGTKDKETLIPIIENNLRSLYACGAKHILIACVTASSLYPYLSPEVRRGAYPIIDYIAAATLEKTRTRRVGIVSTSRTMKEGALKQALLKHGLSVSESEADALVPLCEAGRTAPTDGAVFETVARACRVHKEHGVDTLVLGCTHFPHFRLTFSREMGEGVTLVPSGEVGADGFIRSIPKSVLCGKGRVHFI